MNESMILMSGFSIKAGQLDNFKVLVKEIVADIHENEPHTLSYEVFISEDGASCQFLERYEDSATTLAHVDNFMERFGKRFQACTGLEMFRILGKPSDELRVAMSGDGAMILRRMDGFAR